MRLLLTALFLFAAGPILAAEPAWKEVDVPADWKKAPTGNKGRLWYRAKVAIPANWQGRAAELVVEAVDDAREVYVGGKLVGTLGSFPPDYRSGLGETKRFPVPAESLQAGQRQPGRNPRLQHRGP